MTFTKDEIKRAKAYRIKMNSPNKVEPVEHNYKEEDAISILENHFDEWSKDEDWWCDNGRVDVNVWNDEEDNEIWHVFVCGLVMMSNGYYQTETSNEIDTFQFKIEGEL